MNRQDLIKATLPLLFDPAPRKHKAYARSSYGLKHEVEHALRFYITNDELIEAAVDLGYLYTSGDPNYTFYVKPRFPTSWFNYPFERRTEHPYILSRRCAKKVLPEWANYQAACKTIDETIEALIKDDTSDESQFTKLAKAVGYWQSKE